MHDITARKQIDRKLLDREGRYRNLFESTSDLIQSVTPDGRFRFVNRAWREILGYNELDVASLNFFQIIQPKYLQSYQDMFSNNPKGRVPRALPVGE